MPWEAVVRAGGGVPPPPEHRELSCVQSETLNVCLGPQYAEHWAVLPLKWGEGLAWGTLRRRGGAWLCTVWLLPMSEHACLPCLSM